MAASNSPARIYQLKVTLLDIEPPIWRRIQVRGDVPLYTLHHVLQLAMGWTNSHLHQFIADGVYYGESDLDMEVVNEKSTRLNEIAEQPDDRFLYEYDFGDGWEHDIVVEAITDADPTIRYPQCTDGERSCPPEDVGGAWGYEGFLETLADPAHPEHDESLEWIGEAFDPEAFDLESTSEALRSVR